MSSRTSEFLKGKFKKLKEEGYEGPQRTAIALSMARKKGLDVPPPPKDKVSCKVCGKEKCKC